MSTKRELTCIYNNIYKIYKKDNSKMSWCMKIIDCVLDEYKDYNMNYPIHNKLYQFLYLLIHNVFYKSVIDF